MKTERYGDYEIRSADEKHAGDFVSLHNKIFGSWKTKGEEQFHWKYQENPYLEETPVIIVTKGGRVVAARGYFVMKVNIGGEVFLGLQAADLMVHPDHRRKGIFKKMNEYGRRWLGSPKTIFFSFPNRKARRGYLKEREWHGVKYPLYVCYPKSYLLFGSSGIIESVDSRFLQVGRLAVGDEYSLTLIDEPSTVLGTGDDNKNRINIAKDDEFYSWRLSEPCRTFDAYAVKNDGKTRATFVISYDSSTCYLREIDPLSVSDEVLRYFLSEIPHLIDGVSYVQAWCPNKLGWSTFLRSGLFPRYVPFLSSKNHIIVGHYGGVEAINGVKTTEPKSWSIQLICRDW